MMDLEYNKEKPEDVKRFEEMVSLIYRELYRFIFSIMKNPVISEDCLQNTLLVAYKNFHKLNNKDKFKCWIFTIARHEAFKLLKKTQKEMPGEETSIDIVLNDNNDYKITEEVILNKEMRNEVVNAINSLKPKYRQIINLRYYNNFSFEDISKILGINVNTVRIRHMRAKKFLKKHLTQGYFNSDMEIGRGDI